MIGVAQGEQLYYQALAKQKLGQTDGIDAVFHELVDSGTSALNQQDDSGTSGSFKSRRQSPRNNAATAHYTIGLGYAGLGNKEKAG